MNTFLRVSMLVAGIFLCIVQSTAQTANFSASPVDGCVPLFVQFTSTSTGSISSYSWNLGNSATSSNQNPSTTYTVPGTYTVSLTVSGPGGSNTKTLTNYITVYAPPSVSFTASTTAGCTPLSVSFSPSVVPNAPGSVTYAWNFGDGATSSAAAPTHTYTTTGPFNVTLTVTSGKGCVTTVTHTALVQAYASPIVSFSSPSSVYCSVPANVSFSSTGTAGTTVAWSFGDGGTGSGISATHTYATANSYTVTMTATNAQGCSTTTSNNYTVVQSVNTATFTGTSDVCVGVAASFSNTTSGAASPAVWNFGDLTFASGNNVTHTYTTAGTYPVRMITTTGQCPDTAFGYCNVHPRPVAQIVMSPAMPCPAPVTVVFVGSGSIGGSTYQWSWANGGTATGANVAHAYTTGPQIDTAKLVVTSAYGCKDSTRYYPVMISDAIIMKDSIKPEYGCVPLAVRFKTRLWSSLPSGPYPAPVVGYNWNFGDGNSSAADTVTHTYTSAGTYIVTITLITANGCTIVDTAQIHVGTKVKPSFYVSNTSICFGTLINAINTTTGPGGVTYYYTTSQGQQVLAPGTVTGIPASAGTLAITLHSLNNGCEDTTTLGDSVIVNPPAAAFADSPYCAPSTNVKFYNQSMGATSVLWDFGDGTTSTAYAPTHTYPTRSSYLVRLIAYNNVSGCIDTLYRGISLLPPALTLTAVDTSVCLGDTVHLTGSCSPMPAGTGWSIDNRPPNYLFGSSIDTVLGKGYHTITFITVDFYGCIDSLRKPNYVIVSRPAVAFGAMPLLGCSPLPVTFRDSTTYTPGTAFGSRSWDFGDGGKSTSNTNPLTYTYITPGLYHVKLVVKDFNGCADSLTKYNYIDVRHVTAGFTVNKTTACRGEQLSFTNTSSGALALRYNWIFGDGGTSTAFAPTHAYGATGSYTVRLIVTDTSTGCADTLTRNNYISLTKPVASFTLSDTFSICIPANLMGLSTSTGASSLLWIFGNGSTSSLANPILTFTSPGVYTVRLIAINAAGCADTSAPQTVRVLGYNGALSYGPLSGCVPLTVHYKALIANAPNLVWDFSDGNTNQTAKDTISHTYTTPGKYLPKLIFFNNSGCKASSDGLDTIRVDVLHAGFKVVPPCVYANAQFIDTSKGMFAPPNAWRWDFGGGQIATGPTASRVYSSPGRYPVTLTVSNASGCVDTLSRNFNIYPLPIITASPDTSVCIPDAIAISATGGASYTWSPGATLSCTACLSPLAAPNVPTTYVVTGTDTNGCANKDSVKIGIQVKTTFTVEHGGEICLGEHFQLIAGGATVYHWTPSGSLNDADGAAPIASPTVTTTYVVTAREGTCAADTHMVKVIVNPLPTIDAGTDEKVIAGNSVQLQASGSGISRIEWRADPALSCTDCYAPYAAPKVTTVFYITAFTNKNCTATDSVTVRVLCDQSQLYIPNTFTPNGDGLNDYFFPRGKGIDVVKSFRVYSRWGELMFERTDMAVNDEYAGWNGTYNGQKLSPDVYVYIIEAICDNGEPIKWRGDVTLIR